MKVPSQIPSQLPFRPHRFCAGKVHADRGHPAPLEPLASAGPARIGLIEDGAVFCRACAYELTRGGPGA